MDTPDDTGPADMWDDDLDVLLELADGPRQLSRRTEDRLLRSILRTAAQPRVVEDLDARDAREIELATGRPGRLRFLTAAAAAAIAVACAAIVLVGSGDRPPVIAPIGSEEVPVIDVARAEGAELCDAVALRVARSRLYADDVNVDRDDDALSRDLAALLGELAVRTRAARTAGTPDGPTQSALDDLDAAVDALRLQGLLLESGDSAGAARARQRATTLLLPLLPIDQTMGCPPPVGDDRSIDE